MFGQGYNGRIDLYCVMGLDFGKTVWAVDWSSLPCNFIFCTGNSSFTQKQTGHVASRRIFFYDSGVQANLRISRLIHQRRNLQLDSNVQVKKVKLQHILDEFLDFSKDKKVNCGKCKLIKYNFTRYFSWTQYQIILSIQLFAFCGELCESSLCIYCISTLFEMIRKIEQ